MWPRVVEVMLGCWLGMSPFIFRHPADQSMYWIGDWVAALAVITFGVLSYWRPTRHIHLGTCGVGLVMCAYAYLGEPYPTPPALQNHLVVGLLLIMMGMLPNEASQPPLAWRELE